jgi:hypothetical protein
MANVRGKSIDGTYLSLDTATERGFPHADYIAHCLRWSHVVKFIRDQGRYKDARVFDIGCGKELPLAKTLYSSRLIVKQFVGVDYNKGSTINLAPFHSGKFPIAAFGNVDFASNQVFFDKAEDGTNLINVAGTNTSDQRAEDYWTAPNVYVSFEVMEHIEPAHVRATFDKVKLGLQLAKENGSTFEPVFFMSTPNYDRVHLADNHVNEMVHEALGWLIEDAGLEIRGRYGTFASQRDYKHKLFAEHEGSKAIYEKLHSYYESNYLATIFAPLYPAEARNCLWELTLPTGKPRQFDGPVPPCAEPWTSSERWSDLTSTLEGLYDPANTGVGRIER